MAKPVDWAAIEFICLKSFTGTPLSHEEMAIIQDAHRRFPDEYARRTNIIREQERARLRSI